MVEYLKIRLKNRLERLKLKYIAKKGSQAYWTAYLVDNEQWKTRQQSLDHFQWRNALYPGYIELMPVNNANDMNVLDYGCGPGNDLVGFTEFSKTKSLIGVDVSSTAIKKSKERLALHKADVKLIKIEENENILPVESNSIDLVHSSGVLHHVKNLDLALKEIHRILKPGGSFQVMVYNFDSIWLHLLTAYVNQIEKGLFSKMSLKEAFRASTDGPEVAISKCYKPSDFINLVKNFGFSGKLKGCSMSTTEMDILHKRFKAIESKKLASIHRDFLLKLKFNEFGHPIYEGEVAGMNACFIFKKRNKIK